MTNSGKQTPIAGQPIPTSEDFPVTWENPDDAKLTRQLDIHVTQPMTPLSCSVSAAILRGFIPASGQIGLPIQLRVRFVNGYTYAAGVLANAPPGAVLKTIGAVNRFAPGRTACSRRLHRAYCHEPVRGTLLRSVRSLYPS